MSASSVDDVVQRAGSSVTVKFKVMIEVRVADPLPQDVTLQFAQSMLIQRALAYVDKYGLSECSVVSEPEFQSLTIKVA